MLVKLASPIGLTVFLSIGLLGHSPPCGADTPYELKYADPLNQPWRISRFRELEGRDVRCLTEDASGFMWFGLRNGVVRYDGYTWKYFDSADGLPDDAIQAIATLKDGRLVAASRLGLFQFDGTRWSVVPELQKITLPNVSFIKETSDGSLWVGCGWGLLRLQDGVTTLITSESYVPCVRLSGRHNNILTFPNECLPTRSASPGTGIRLVGQEVAYLAEESPAKAAGLQLGDRVLSVNGNPTQHIRALQRVPNSTVRLQIQRREDGALANLEFLTTAISPRIYFSAMHSMLEDSQGRLWVGTQGNKLIRSDDFGLTWHEVKGGSGLQLGIRPTAIETSNGDILVVSAGRNSAVCRFDGSTWTNDPLFLLTGANFISSITETVEGTIWVSGLNRLFVHHQGEWVMHDTRDLDLPGEGHRMFVASDRALWIVGFGQFAARIALSPDECLSLKGVSYQCTDSSGAEWFIETETERVIRRGNGKTIAFDNEDNLISHPNGIKPTRNGVVVAGRDGRAASLCVYDGQQWQKHRFPDVASDFSGSSILVTDDDEIWVAATGERNKNQVGGVVGGDGIDWRHHAPPNAPLTATSIIELSDGRLMFAGGYGITTYDGSKWRKLEHKVFQNNRCPSMVVDSDDTVWIASATRGVIRSHGDRWESLAADYGLETLDVNSVVARNKDEVWASTSRGVFRFDGNRFYRMNIPIAIGRRSLKLDEKGSLWLDGRHRLTPSSDRPRVTVTARTVAMEYDSRSVVDLVGVDRWNRSEAMNLSFSTKLDDEEWTPFLQQSFLVLEGLNSGKHTLRIRARDEDFNISSLDQVISISMAPPFWRTPSFLAICSFAVLTLVWQAYRLARRGRELGHTNMQLQDARIRLEHKIAETSAQFRAVCDCSPVGILVADSAADATYANRRMLELMGVDDTSSALGNGWVRALHPDDRERILDGWREAVTAHSRFYTEGRLVHTSGVHVCFELVADCIKPDGEQLGYVCAVEDVTEQRRAEHELNRSNKKLVETLERLEHAQESAIQQERLGALGQMAAGVAHDMNNALSPMLTYAELLGNEKSESDRVLRWAELIRLGVSDLAETVRRLDHFYREAPDREKLHSTDLVELVKQTVEMTRPKWVNASAKEGKRVFVSVSATSSPTVNVVASQIRSALTNLIFNSVDAIDGFGRIEIRVASIHHRAVLEIQDNGIGMTQEQLARCLEPFYTSKAKGSGLGLSECHGIIRQHGGTLAVESKREQGTKIRLDLPLDQHSELRMSESVRKEPKPNSFIATKARVLYVDDDVAVRQSTAALLDAIGLQVALASDAIEALEMMNQSEFRLVLSDFGLPGLNGGELLERIKTTWPATPVVIVSGWSNPVPKDCIQPDAYLQKPFSVEDLTDILQICLPVRKPA